MPHRNPRRLGKWFFLQKSSILYFKIIVLCKLEKQYDVLKMGESIAKMNAQQNCFQSTQQEKNFSL